MTVTIALAELARRAREQATTSPYDAPPRDERPVTFDAECPALGHDAAWTNTPVVQIGQPNSGDAAYGVRCDTTIDCPTCDPAAAS